MAANCCTSASFLARNSSSTFLSSATFSKRANFSSWALAAVARRSSSAASCCSSTCTARACCLACSIAMSLALASALSMIVLYFFIFSSSSSFWPRSIFNVAFNFSISLSFLTKLLVAVAMNVSWLVFSRCNNNFNVETSFSRVATALSSMLLVTDSVENNTASESDADVPKMHSSGRKFKNNPCWVGDMLWSILSPQSLSRL